jgi:hypothetical protein
MEIIKEKPINIKVNQGDVPWRRSKYSPRKAAMMTGKPIQAESLAIRRKAYFQELSFPLIISGKDYGLSGWSFPPLFQS